MSATQQGMQSQDSAAKRLLAWIDARFPLSKMFNEHAGE